LKTTPLNIGRQPQLLLDNWIVELTHFSTRTLHSPQKRAEPVLRADRPWEKLLYFRTNTWNVHLDPQENLYKCWYEDMAWDYEAFMGRGKSVEDGTTPDFYSTTEGRYLYAQSSDGIHWEKPLLDYRQIDGQKTNICLGDGELGEAHACSVLMDPIDTDPKRRFKALFWNQKPGGVVGRLVAGHSPDGRVWTVFDEPVTVGESAGHMTGDVIILTADPVSGEYWLDTRIPAMVERPMNPKNPKLPGWGFPQYPGDPWRITVRNIWSTVTTNMLQWPGLRQMLVADDVDDNLDFEYYGMVRFRIGDLWLALVNVHRRVENTQEIHLMFSRDGFQWKRTGEHRPFMTPGEAGTWDCFMAETCNPPLMLDDEMRIYYAGGNLHHDFWMFGEMEGLDHPEACSGWDGGHLALGLATMRPEGFVSIDTGVRDGLLITRPFICDAGQLQVNVACGNGGYFDVELTDADDDVVPGFERSACDTFTGDAARHVVTWNGRSQLPRELLARGVKLRFYNRSCSIYSFRIVAAS